MRYMLCRCSFTTEYSSVTNKTTNKLYNYKYIDHCSVLYV